MKTISKYQQAKQSLKSVADEAKKVWKDDKPLIRMIINDEVNDLSCNLTEYESTLLSNYACKLHP